MSERDLKIADRTIRGHAGETSGHKTTAELLFAAVRSGETRALARAVSLVEDGGAEALSLQELCREMLQGRERVFRIGITGPAGAGKSTLVDALTRELRRQGRRVGIVAVDPSSAFSGGAILGDRIRLTDLAGDPGIYMRSMATRGHLGGVAKATKDVLTVIEAAWADDVRSEAAGRDVLLIETTGVGQGEIEVVGLADAVVVVLVPGMGDSVQSLKAGVLEIASVFVLNKADQPGVERLEAEIGEMLALSAVVSGDHPEGGMPKVLKTVATAGDGVGELLEVLDSLATGGRSRREISERYASGAKAPLLYGGSNVRAEALTYLDQDTEAEELPNFSRPVLDHLGIAVRSIADSMRLYEALGAAISGVEEVAHERVRVAMIAMGESRIELLEAIEADSAVGRFLAKRGEGLHHVALRVPDLTAAVERMKEMGVRLVSETIQVGAGGHRYVFVHPQSANGVLLELVEAGDVH